MFVLYCSDEFGFNCILGVFSTEDLVSEALAICQKEDSETGFDYYYRIQKFNLDSHDGMAVA